VTYNQEQREFLRRACAETPADIANPITRLQFTEIDPRPDDAPPVQDQLPPGMPRLDVQKLSDAGLHPQTRLEIFEHWQTLETDHREKLRGIQPEWRSSRHEIDRAQEMVGPWLIKD